MVETASGGLLRISEVAHLLNIGTSTMYRWIRDGGGELFGPGGPMPIVRIGPTGRARIRAQDVDAYLGSLNGHAGS